MTQSLCDLIIVQAVFSIRKLDGGAHLIECDGIGLENPVR